MSPGEAMADSSVRVLMIEDDPAYSELVRLHLADPGLDGFAAQVDAAGSLAEGLRMLEEREYDAVLSDLGLPDAQGLESVSAVLTRFPDVPLLVCTNTGDDTLGLEAVRRGAQDFLRKSEADSRWLRRAIRYAIERKSARRHDELKDRWIAVLSHELRTPLTVIKGVLADLAEGADEQASPRQQLMLGMARRHVDRIARMVVNLLDLSRLESGRARIERRAFDAAALARSAATDVERAARERGVGLETMAAADAPAVVGDPDLFVQLVTNLVDNAARYASKRVQVRAERAPDGAFRLTVTDDGPGIPEEARSLLFTRFSQLERRRGPDTYRGTGLGLAICKEIAVLHHGRIDLESSPGRGTSFIVTLPDVAIPAPVPSGPAAPRRADGTKPRVVLVDDEPDFLRILEMWLKPHYEVTSFERSAGAVERIRALMPDLVVLDVHMSEESGFKMCRRLKSDAATAHIPVVFLSGSKSNEDIRLHAEVGGARYLTKPISRQAFLEALAEQLAGAAA